MTHGASRNRSEGIPPNRTSLFRTLVWVVGIFFFVDLIPCQARVGVGVFQLGINSRAERLNKGGEREIN